MFILSIDIFVNLLMRYCVYMWMFCVVLEMRHAPSLQQVVSPSHSSTRENVSDLFIETSLAHVSLTTWPYFLFSRPGMKSGGSGGRSSSFILLARFCLFLDRCFLNITFSFCLVLLSGWGVRTQRSGFVNTRG